MATPMPRTWSPAGSDTLGRGARRTLSVPFVLGLNGNAITMRPWLAGIAPGALDPMDAGLG
jgi:hypothetical protein